MNQPMPHLRPTAEHEAMPMARPKLLRRPAQFADAAPQLAVNSAAGFELPAVIPAVENPAPPVTSTARSWQDDGRFGLVMLCIVILTNVGLMAWLPHLNRGEKSVPTLAVIQGSALPGPTPSHPQITTYSRDDAPAENAPVLSHAVELRTTPAATVLDVPSAPAPHLLGASAEDTNP